MGPEEEVVVELVRFSSHADGDSLLDASALSSVSDSGIADDKSEWGDPGSRKSATLSVDGVCQTAGFLQSQNPQLKKFTSSVRFVVQPVEEPAGNPVDCEEACEPLTAEICIEDPLSSFTCHEDQVYQDDLQGVMGSDPQSQMTVRSLASIGLGSSDGRKIHLRKVHTTGAESLLHPLLTDANMVEGFQTPWPYPMKITAAGKMAESNCSTNDESDSDSYPARDNSGKKIKHHRRRRHGQLWGSRLEFLLACIGFAVGLGNVWRFPYTAYKSNGGAFLVPYCIMVFFCGIPLQIMELAVGQYTRDGPVDAMKNISPLLSGVGVAMVVLSYLLSSYYSVVMAWSMLYLSCAFSFDLPWTHCNNTWNTENCHVAFAAATDVIARDNGTLSLPANATASRLLEQVAFQADRLNSTHGYAVLRNWSSPGQEFFDRRILNKTDGIESIGTIQWELAGCLLMVWVLLYVTIRKSIRWSGKAVYVTATLPYILLLALTARALTLNGAHEGLRYLFYPKWSMMLDAQVWQNALAQTFMSVGIAYGCLIAYSSYNRFHGPFLRDAFCLSALNSFTSLVAGIIAFAALGHISSKYNLKMDEAANDGLSFSLVMYTTVVSEMPFPQLWMVFLFLTFIFLGLDTQFAIVEVVLLTLQSWLKPLCRKRRKVVREFIVIGLCLACFVGALPYITQAGIYFMHLLDYYVATVGIVLLALCEVFSVGILYGAGRLGRNIREMTAHSPSPILMICWAGVAPAIILGVWIFNLIGSKDLTYNHGGYSFPSWSTVLGALIVTLLLAPIPLSGIVAVVQANGKTVFQKLVNASKSQMTECPCCRRGVNGLKDTHSEVHLSGDIQLGQQTFSFAGFASVAFPEETLTDISSLPSPPHLTVPVQFLCGDAEQSSGLRQANCR